MPAARAATAARRTRRVRARFMEGRGLEVKGKGSG
jgi:hypothetical protein